MEAVRYLLGYIFDLFTWALILRVWLQLVRADFYNPLSQFVVKVTNPVVIPFRRVIPSLGGLDLATVIIAILVCFIKWGLFQLMAGGAIDILITLLIAVLSVIKQSGFLLFMIMLVMAIMSWVVQTYNPTLAVFHQLTEPILRPIRNIIPPIGGLDLSVLIAFLALNFINIFLSGIIPFWAAL